MNFTDFVAEIEADYTWRETEIRFHQNIISNLDESEAKKLRRAALLMIYAHFEGYAKFCFEHFINMINSLLIKCADATYPLAASTLYDVFNDLYRAESKSKIFVNLLPEDKKLHRLSRQVELLERLNYIDNVTVKISDKVADTESNLKPVVLKKLLYEVGLDYTKFDHLERKIFRLLNLRNDIAHGGSKYKLGIFLSDYNLLKDMARDIMLEIKDSIINAIRDSEYLKPKPISALSTTIV
jgi:hypothetical protein